MTMCSSVLVLLLLVGAEQDALRPLGGASDLGERVTQVGHVLTLVLALFHVVARLVLQALQVADEVVAGLLHLQLVLAGAREDKLKVQQSGYHFVSDLEGLKDKARDYVKEGEYEGQDVSDLRDALAEIRRATKWTQSVLFGTDEEEEDED